MEDHDFETVLNNYRYGAQKVIPAYLAGGMADEEAYVDELALMLHSRDELEWAFAVSPRLWQKYGAQVNELDRLLLTMKEVILERIPNYVTFRQQFPRPRSHWWYYFDEIVSLPAKPAADGERLSTPEGYWIPVVPLKTMA